MWDWGLGWYQIDLGIDREFHGGKVPIDASETFMTRGELWCRRGDASTSLQRILSQTRRQA